MFRARSERWGEYFWPGTSARLSPWTYAGCPAQNVFLVLLLRSWTLGRLRKSVFQGNPFPEITGGFGVWSHGGFLGDFFADFRAVCEILTFPMFWFQDVLKGCLWSSHPVSCLPCRHYHSDVMPISPWMLDVLMSLRGHNIRRDVSHPSMWWPYRSLHRSSSLLKLM